MPDPTLPLLLDVLNRAFDKTSWDGPRMSRIEHILLPVPSVRRRLPHFAGRQMAVTARGLEFRIGVAFGADAVSNILSQLRVEFLGAAAALGDEVFQRADAGPAM